uniref:Uncharacterized protein n=1 Tax=Panagrolaimus davidi TaxID=227884 RepID=A0A914PJB6_9BILA
MFSCGYNKNLYIAAYENSVETSASDSFESGKSESIKKKDLVKKWEGAKHPFLCSTQKQFADYLPGGIHHLISDEIIQTVPKSNRLCESVFGNVTWEYRHAPNQRVVRRSTKIEAHFNGLFDWYKSKPEKEQEDILREAILSAPELEKAAAAEEIQLQDAIYNRICERRAANIIADGIKQRKKETASKNADKYGGEWLSEDIMNDHLRDLSDAEKRKAVAAQLKYHQFVLETEPSKSKLFTLSFKGKQKSLQSLIGQLNHLINLRQEQNDDDGGEDDE